MENVAPNSKFIGHSTEIILQSKIRAPLKILNSNLKQNYLNSEFPNWFDYSVDIFYRPGFVKKL